MHVPVMSFDADTTARPLVGPVEAPQLHLMTLNVRRRMPEWWPPPADRWRLRKPLLHRLLTAERPTVLGLQEVMPGQSEDIRGMLGPEYAHVGSGRSAARGGERCEVHYDTRRLRLVTTDIWWLSARPAEPGSRSFGNLLPRMVVQVRLQDLRTGVRFNVMTVQLDHLSRRSRALSARLLHRRVSGLDGPTVVMGDFNTGANSGPHRQLADGVVLEDALELATHRVGSTCGTYTRYRAPRRTGRRLDWILITPGASVVAAGVNPTRIAGRAPSDHEPVHAVVAWGPSVPPADGKNRE
ncbi:endonuclease/exonuclease/phosphatase family protein [Micrococcaceae bacterium RIT802]|nr:endonuclease/exonuclease/phosphatase family protein [Micrococcaceae bacterium RIT 802]